MFVVKPPKLKLWAHELDFQEWATKNSHTYNLNTTKPIFTKIFTGDSHHELAFMGGTTNFPNKSNMEMAAMLNFGKL